MAIKRFLLIDKDEERLSTFKGVLSELQYQEVNVCDDGDKVMDIIDAKNIDFVTVYWDLQPTSGATIVQRIRADTALAFLPIMVYSQRLKPEDLRLLGELGIDNLLPMPFERSKVKTMIEKIAEEENKVDDTLRRLRDAHGLLTEGKLDDAITLSKECTADEKHVMLAATIAGSGLFAKADYEESEKYLQMALAKNAQHAPAMQAMAKVYAKTGRADEAVKMLGKMAEFSPKNISTRVGLGAAYTEQGDLEKAKEAFEQAKDIDPDCAEANDGLGVIAFQEGNFELAKEFLSETKNSAEVASNLNSIAVGLIANEKFDEGIQHYQAALDILSDHAVTHLLQYNLGLAHKKKGDLENAFSYLCESYIKNPSFEKAYVAIARTSKEMKEQGIEISGTLVKQVKKVRGASKPKDAAPAAESAAPEGEAQPEAADEAAASTPEESAKESA